MAFGETKQKSTPDILRMDEKNIRQAEIIREDDMKLEPRNFERTDKI